MPFVKPPQISCRPLHLRVPPKLKQKIWDGEFVDLAQILEDQSNLKYTLQLDEYGSVGLTQASQKKFLTIERWTDAFCIFSSVFRQKYPECTEGLATYQHVVRNIAKAGGNWYTYDTSFRRLKQTASDMQWGSLEQELYCMAMTSSRSKSLPYNRKNNTTTTNSTGNSNFRSNVGTCFRFNKGTHCGGCKYAHICGKCGGKHPQFKCADKTSKPTSSTTAP